MRTTLCRLLVAFALVPLAAFAQPKSSHTWEHIYYPDVLAPWDSNETICLLVGSGQSDDKPEFRLTIGWMHDTRDPSAGKNLPDPKDFVLQLHHAHGEVDDAPAALDHVRDANPGGVRGVEDAPTGVWGRSHHLKTTNDAEFA